MKEQPKIIQLGEKDIPEAWYNVLPDLPKPLEPPLHPATRQPIGPDDLAPIFPMGLIEQEVSQERYIDIPGEVLDVYRIWRPTPFIRATRLEKHLQTPARIYYKNEGVSPAGSHKPNTAVAQAYYNKKEGVRKLTTETGAGQWGSALAMGCCFFGLELQVFMVRSSYQQKPYRRVLMETWGAKVQPSPSEMTETGRKVLEKDPDTPGSLGIAISEAIELAVQGDDVKYSLGSVLNHVLLHQTVIGLEAKKAFELVDDYPDMVIGCVGGGSNFGGTALPFVVDRLQGKDIRLIAVEPTSCPTLTSGRFEYDFGDTAEMTPLLLMYTLGHEFVPPPSHAGGLRYHGDAPIISLLVKEGVMEARAYHQVEVFEAAVTFARTEGIVPAPETSHAIKAVIDEAVKCRESGESKCIFFNFSGHGLLDLAAYDEYLSGRLSDV
ncbi:TrpB-like pyridoxal phosphate-dependent enzyme [Candidatus Solincola sp.]|nr:TrpB-like pyridoxal phosphate-dependent enzyme [Actinomycetota bacterium]MDI7253219.1 TrpB-like pyridoxal phosphate-dependent enzyme [Actinomycetota bacterium]